MDLLSTLNNPSMLHSAAVHMPVVLAVLGFVALVLAALFQRYWTPRCTALVLYLALAGSAYYAEQTGTAASELVSNRMGEAVWERIEEHESLGINLKYGALAAAAFLLLSLVNRPEFRTAMLLLAGCAGFVTLLMTGVTAHLGGTLVYEYGVGTDPIKAAYDTEEEGAAGAPAVEVPGTADVMPVRPIDMAVAEQVSFTEDVWPIVDQYCVLCHEPPEPESGYDMSTYEKLIAGGDKVLKAVLPGKPDKSPLIQYCRGVLQPQMPKGEDPIPAEALHTLRMWIAAGAEGPAPEEEEAAEDEEVFSPFG